MGTKQSAAQTGLDTSDWQVKTGLPGMSVGTKYALIAGGVLAAVWAFLRMKKGR